MQPSWDLECPHIPGTLKQQAIAKQVASATVDQHRIRGAHERQNLPRVRDGQGRWAEGVMSRMNGGTNVNPEEEGRGRGL